MVQSALGQPIFAIATIPLLLVPVRGLSNIRLAIPNYAVCGSDVAFNCSFNLQHEELYSVRWYRGTHEIFRFIPSQTPPTMAFLQEWFNISPASTKNSLHLLDISFINSGNYSCEVTSEGSFHTLTARGTMTVVERPQPHTTTNVSSKGRGIVHCGSTLLLCGLVLLIVLINQHIRCIRDSCMK